MQVFKLVFWQPLRCSDCRSMRRPRTGTARIGLTRMRGPTPNPSVMFDRLDANHDGVITSKEVPGACPMSWRRLLVQAIKKSDGKLTKAA